LYRCGVSDHETHSQNSINQRWMTTQRSQGGCQASAYRCVTEHRFRRVAGVAFLSCIYPECNANCALEGTRHKCWAGSGVAILGSGVGWGGWHKSTCNCVLVAALGGRLVVCNAPIEPISLWPRVVQPVRPVGPVRPVRRVRPARPGSARRVWPPAPKCAHAAWPVDGQSTGTRLQESHVRIGVPSLAADGRTD
jgi:hypothetical protein